MVRVLLLWLWFYDTFENRSVEQIGLLGKSLKPKEVKHGSITCKEKYHENEPVEYYCRNCKVCICHKCSVVNHNRHTLVDIQNVVEERKLLIKKLFDSIEAKVADVEAKMKKQTEMIKSREGEIKSAEREMTKTVEEGIRLMNEHKTAIKIELNKIRDAQQEKHTINMKRFEECATQMRNFLEYGEDIVQRSTGPEILEAEHTVYSRCKELLTAEEIQIYKPLHVTYVSRCSFLAGQVLVLASHTDPSKSTAEGKGLKEAELGREAVFFVTTRDSEGTQVYDNESQVMVKIVSPAEEDVETKIKDCEDGNHIVRYKPDSVGLHKVVIEANGKPLGNSPWSVQVTPHTYKVVSSIGSFGRGKRQFEFPSSVAVSKRTGNIAIADNLNHRVQLLDSEGKYLRTIGDKATDNEMTGNPASLTFTAFGDLMVIYDRDELPRKLKVFSERGDFIKNMSDHLVDPDEVSVGVNGDIIVSDKEDRTVKVFSPDGTHLLQSISVPIGDGQLNFSVYPVYHQDKFFVSCLFSGCTKVFSKNGKFLYTIGSLGSGDGQLNSPLGLAIDRFNNLVVCDNGNGRIQVFSLEGQFLNSVYEGMKAPFSVAVTADGDLLVSDGDKNCLHVLH